MLIDPYTTWVIGHEHRNDLLREAQVAQVIADLPKQPFALRMRVSGWLRSLANRLEPSAEPLTHARQAHAEPLTHARQAHAHAR
jgi:hypothetical protein